MIGTQQHSFLFAEFKYEQTATDTQTKKKIEIKHKNKKWLPIFAVEQTKLNIEFECVNRENRLVCMAHEQCSK